MRLHHLRNTFFCGRDEILSQLRQRFLGPEREGIPGIQVLSGLGGVGKTQIAVEYVYRHHSEYQHVFWINAAAPLTLSAGFRGVAKSLGMPEAEEQDEAAAFEAVQRWLSTHGNWLIVLDNADETEHVRPAIVGNARGHYLLTSRASNFNEFGVTQPVQVGVMLPGEATDFLLIRTGRRDTSGEELEAAEEIAKALGELPLALEQAGGYIASRQLSFSGYLASYRTRRLELLAKSPPKVGDYKGSVATTWSLNLDAVREESPGAAEVLEYCGFLFPDDIPFELLVRGSDELGGQIAVALKGFYLERTESGDATAYNESLLSDLLFPLTRYSLAQIFSEGLTLSIHRLVQEVIRDGMTQERAKSRRAALIKALAFVFPIVDFEFWGLCDRLLPHALEVVGPINESELESPAGGTLLHRMGHYLEETGRYQFAYSVYDCAVRIRSKVLGNQHPDLGTSVNNLGLTLFKLGRFEQSEKTLRLALQIRTNALGENHRDVAQTWNNLALAVGELGDLNASYEYLMKSKEIFDSDSEGDEEGKLTRLNNIAGILHRRGKDQEAETIMRQVIEARERLFGPEHPDVAFALCNLAVFVGKRGETGEALGIVRRAMSIQENTTGELHPDYGRATNIYGSLLEQDGQHEAAIVAYMKAGDIKAHTMGTSHPDIGTVYNNLGHCYDQMGDTDAAIKYYEKAIRLLEATVGPNHLDLTAPLSNLAHCYIKAREGTKAKELLERVLVMRRSVLGEVHNDVAVALGSLAFVESRIGTSKGALNFYESADAIYLALGDPPIRDCRVFLDNYRSLLRRMSLFDAAAAITKRLKALGEG